MKDFIIFFGGREGTSAFVRLLDEFDGISMVHHEEDNKGWEPFDAHNCGPMPLRRLLRCLGQVFAPGAVDMEALDAICTATCEPFARMYRLLLRRGLCQHHGSGSGEGHLQFGLASGPIRRSDIGRITVDCDRLAAIIDSLERSYEQKRRLFARFEAAAIDCASFRCEDFLTDETASFQRLCGLIGLEITPEEVARALEQGAYCEKVHSDDISIFVENYEEVIERFGDRYAPCPC